MGSPGLAAGAIAFETSGHFDAPGIGVRMVIFRIVIRTNVRINVRIRVRFRGRSFSDGGAVRRLDGSGGAEVAGDGGIAAGRTIR